MAHTHPLYNVPFVGCPLFPVLLPCQCFGDNLPNKLFALGRLSQGLLLRDPNSRKLTSQCSLFSIFLGPHPRHMEVARLGVKLELQLLAYTTATTMKDPSLICDLHCSSQQCQILNPLGNARDQTCILIDTNKFPYQSHNGNSPVAFRSTQLSPPAIPRNILSHLSLSLPFLQQQTSRKKIYLCSLASSCRNATYGPPHCAENPSPRATDLTDCPTWLIQWWKQSHILLLIQETPMGNCLVPQGTPPPPNPSRQGPESPWPESPWTSPSLTVHSQPNATFFLSPPKLLLILSPLSVAPAAPSASPLFLTWVTPAASSLIPPQGLCICCSRGLAHHMQLTHLAQTDWHLSASYLLPPKLALLSCPHPFPT
uniref:Uncharacterized protein n=1 Tax=Sus scrofa TaxID=9823 RepID=A0A8D1CJ57_PIG